MSDSATLPILVALAIQLAIGTAVFQANPRRQSNQCFLLLSLIAAVWLAVLYRAFTTNDPVTASDCIGQASAMGALILTALNLLRLSIRQRQGGWGATLRHSWTWLVAATGIVALCQTHFFIASARIVPHPSSVTAVPVPVYGSGFILYAIYFAAATVALIIFYLRDVRATTGGEHAELSFILIGGAATLGLSIVFALTLRFFIEPSQLIWFGPFRVVPFSAVIAYGIATRRIMEVGFFLRRAISYALLTAYLLTLYGIVWWLVGTVFQPTFAGDARSIAHVTAAITVAFAMAPARGISQSFADRLFVSTRGIDFRATVSKAADILASVTTLRDLLDRFARTIAEAVGTERVMILLREGRGFLLRDNPGQTAQPFLVPTSSAIISYLESQRTAIVLDELYRIRATRQTLEVVSEMQALEVAAVVGIFSRDHLSAVMLLGPRLSGRIYGSVEQNALQVLCGQLAVAIENAELFTEVQNAKIYNETLLENLTTGVIAAGTNERVTVFNKEAEQITGRRADSILEQPLDNLPPTLRDVLVQTLRTRELQEHRELIVRSTGHNIIVRASSSIFHSENGTMLGALMVLTDITALKRLELQIRRSDRLASLGTLSAGMAHEIKNPLVSIKTFAQLLPERYQDSDFRDTFSNLIGHEIDRIDSLVNQLLRFARPAKPLLAPMHVHETLEKSLMLVGHRLYQKEIKLTRSWQADVDTIRADADQLEQVFLNFFLNAMDAMNHGGQLTVTTEIRPGDEWAAAIGGSNGEAHEILRITISDTGEGIKQDDIAHVFDPFFTTKDYGTGLGLSVVHGIIQEHGGQIEVESELSKGTAFHILLPLVRFREEVAAA